MSCDGERGVGEGLESRDGELREGAILFYVEIAGMRLMDKDVRLRSDAWTLNSLDDTLRTGSIST